MLRRIDSRQYTQFFYKRFARASKFGGAMGGCNIRSILPINVPKYNGGEIQKFDEHLSTYNLEPGLYTSITDIVEAMNTLI